MNTSDGQKTAGELMSDVIGNLGNLVRHEIDLARTEISASLKSVAVSVGAILIAAILALTGLNVLMASLITLLVWMGMQPHWATLAVGVGLLLIAILIASSAISNLKQIGFVPTRTARNVMRDATAVKDAYNDQ